MSCVKIAQDKTPRTIGFVELVAKQETAKIKGLFVFLNKTIKFNLNRPASQQDDRDKWSAEFGFFKDF